MNHFVSGGNDGTLRVWAANDPDDYKHLLVNHERQITSMQHNEDKIISGARGALKMWDIQTGQFLHDLITDVDVIWQVAFDERRCVAAVKE
jgi:WD40 repeat protein